MCYNSDVKADLYYRKGEFVSLDSKRQAVHKWAEVGILSWLRLRKRSPMWETY